MVYLPGHTAEAIVTVSKIGLTQTGFSGPLPSLKKVLNELMTRTTVGKYSFPRVLHSLGSSTYND